MSEVKKWLGNWWFFAVLNGLILTIPFWFTTFVPLTDLAQHTAQIRLFLDVLQNPDSLYKIQWLTPYSLVHVFTLLGWYITGPLNAGRFSASMVVFLTVITLHYLVYKKQRPVQNAVLASIFIYSAVLYWGFIQFMLGFPLFLIWIVRLNNNKENNYKDLILTSLLALVIYFTHILWLSISVAVYLGHLVLTRQPVKIIFYKVFALLPALILVAIWYPTLQGSSYNSITVWDVPVYSRVISFSYFVKSTLGGLKNIIEPIVVVMIFLWGALAIWQNKKRKWLGADKLLLLTGLFLLVLYIFLPYKYTNTILFNQRWMPFSFILMILSIPEIKFSSFIKNLIPIAFVISFISLTAVVWKAFEAEEMSGVKDVINTVENDSKILTLSFQTDSSFVQGRAFIQMFAYCQVVKKGELNFSFADFKPSLVVYKTPRQYYWTNGLEWLPQYFKLPDALYFDYLITSGDKDVYNKFSNAPFFTPLTNSKKWNIFKINKNKIYSFIKSRENNGPVKAVEN